MVESIPGMDRRVTHEGMRPVALLTVTLTLLIAAILCLLATPAMAKKTDVVVTREGVRFVGEIKKLEFGLLKLKMDEVKGEVLLKWDHVVRVTSTTQLNVELRDGQRLLGSLVEPSADDFVSVRTSSGEFEVRRTDVVVLEPIEATFSQRVKADVSTGVSFTKSADILQLNFGGSVRYLTDRAQTDLSLSTINTVRDDGTTSNSDIPLTHYRYFKSIWFYRGDVGASRNDELGIDFRGLLGGGIGGRLVHSNHAMFQVSTLLLGNREFTSDDRTSYNLEGVFDTTLMMFRYDSPKLEIDVGLTAFMSLTDWGRYRISGDGRISFELVKDLFWDVGQIYYRYDSRPSETAVSKSDWGLVSGLRYKFH